MSRDINRLKIENIPGNHKNMIAWLEANVEPASKYNNDGHPIPYYASATSQIAKYAGQTSLWHLEVRGSRLYKVVEISEPKLLVKFAIECYDTNSRRI